MSRIAGVLLGGDADHRSLLLEQMIAALRSSAGWKATFLSCGDAALGWCGWRVPNCADAPGLIVVMDGYIYNREDWGDAATDAELFATLYRRYGFEGAVQKINGDFAIALYDCHSHSLWLARDRFGVKPLYYATSSGYLTFASRPRPLLRTPGITLEPNQRYVALFAASHYRYFDNDLETSPYADIAQIPSAHMMRSTRGHLTKARYWHLEDLPDFTEPESVVTGRYYDLLLDAVSLRLKSAEKPAFTLSGGMDSSSVLALAAKDQGDKPDAFSTVYSDKTFDESDDIQPMLKVAVKQWHPIMIGTPDLFEVVQRMIQAHDEPVATATWLSHFLLCEEAAKRSFGSLFGGLGGDELNAGEYEYFPYYFADLRVAGEEPRLAHEIRMWAHYHDHPTFRKNPFVAESSLARLVDLNRLGRCLPDRPRMYRYMFALDRDYFDLQAFEPVMDHPFRSYLKNRTYQDLIRETIPCCVRSEDRQTTAFSLDKFLPFLDHRLAEFMYRVPGKSKTRNGVTKILLRQAMLGTLPEETRSRVKKTGWNAPAHVWFSGSGRTRLLDIVHSRRFRERGIYNTREVIRIINDHERIVQNREPRENHMMFLWQLLNLELWLSSLE